ncbi:farnesyl pyrophosphate synthase-like [Anastrepha ludens]|uniref:farnesyl pyrophosphate synthase-like n=1 Tax=Anastrepha ludens TaxID=28586 RepID=UPI0023AFE8F0|nr:farnesyl pyrophosphate synthase-like [Anastrepha ludens]XP_053962460.1 farnesyl pyrophosphate synthase-like [Anastrepha ludens]XP_053962461.1 farnesyl pyrophosphate synthase-like [Anastrepha ludens]
MLSKVRRWPQIYSTVRATIGACCAHANHTTFAQPPVSQRIGKSARACSTMENPYPGVKISNEENREFMDAYPDIARDLAEIVGRDNNKDAAKWFRKALDYNIATNLKKNGPITALTYKCFVKGNELTAEKLKLALILGWSIELLHYALLMFDDIMDKSTTRRGQVCWNALENVGLNAVNDALMIENSTYVLLRKHFRHLDCYVDLIDLFHESCFECLRGQSIDMLIGKRNVSTFTMEACNAIVDHKTSSHLLYLPVAAGMHLAGVKNQKVYDECKAITFELGHFFQVQNDFLDCFGNPHKTGKTGTEDIQANKCTWLVASLLEKASPEQKNILEECYGQDDPEKLARVKQLYEELNIRHIYAKYEEESYRRIKKLIQNASEDAPREVFQLQLNVISDEAFL